MNLIFAIESYARSTIIFPIYFLRVYVNVDISSQYFIIIASEYNLFDAATLDIVCKSQFYPAGDVLELQIIIVAYCHQDRCSEFVVVIVFVGLYCGEIGVYHISLDSAIRIIWIQSNHFVYFCSWDSAYFIKGSLIVCILLEFPTFVTIGFVEN